jgi:hypothetical protein
MPYESIFLIPPIVGIAWVVYQFIQHGKEGTSHCPFHLTQRDGILYVVPTSKVNKP